MKVLFIGDVVGNPGRKAIKEVLGQVRKEYKIDFCIANGENAAGGSGINCVIANELFGYGIDVITLGNHTWSKKEIHSFIDSEKRMIRPANFSQGLPGIGSTIVEKECGKIGVINLMGRIYMDPADCPFRAAVREITQLKNHVKVVIIDFHAEATSEKSAMAWYLDGKVSAVLGTHTHVQTADEKILPFGTAFITDAGMTGPSEGIIGVDREIIIEKFLTNMPTRFDVAKGKLQFNAVYMDIDETCGKVKTIQRINKILES